MHPSAFQRQIKLLFRRVFMNWGGITSRENMRTTNCREILSFLPLLVFWQCCRDENGNSSVLHCHSLSPPGKQIHVKVLWENQVCLLLVSGVLLFMQNNDLIFLLAVPWLSVLQSSQLESPVTPVHSYMVTLPIHGAIAFLLAGYNAPESSIIKLP